MSRPRTSRCLICLSGALVTLPFVLGGGAAAAAPWGDTGAWLALAALALLPTLVGHGSNTYAVRFFPPLLVSFTTLLEPLLSTLAAFLVLAERPPAVEVPAYAIFAASTALSTDMPTSAAWSAGASLMPSPMYPTTWPARFNARMMRSF